MLKYCFCTMIGSCTSCLYMRIEIHSCCPAFSPFPLPKEVEKKPKVPENRLSSPLWSRLFFPHTSVCPLSNVTTLKLQSLSVLKNNRFNILSLDPEVGHYLREVLSEVSEVVEPQPSMLPPWSTMSMSPISSLFGM